LSLLALRLLMMGLPDLASMALRVLPAIVPPCWAISFQLGQAA
jgi:hypothetical protein